MRVAIRVDASQAIGTGHVRRCLALAHALRKSGAELRFVTRSLGIDSVAMIANEGFEGTALLDPPGGVFTPDRAIPHAEWGQVSQARDVEDTAHALGAFAPDWILVDSYAFGAEWHDGVRDRLGCRIAAIDDLADRALDCEVVIDHTFAPDHRAKYAAVLPRNARLLGGPRFALLGPAYADAPRYEMRGEVGSIGVFMGGVDADDVSTRVLDALDLAGFSGPVEVVTTSANPNLEALRKRVAERDRASLLVDLPDLSSFLARHDLQVGAGGGASWERCCIGVPTLLVVVARNQMSVAPLLAEAGIADIAPDPSPYALAEKLAALLVDEARRSDMAEKARRLVDGRGAERVALALLADSLTVRAARADDSSMLFEWRNHPSTRAASSSSAPIVREEHEAWLAGVLPDPDRELYIGEIGRRAVGSVRFDFGDSDEAEVSLYLDPALHGCGLGPALLLAGEAAADPALIRATVLEANRPSQRLFEHCGYSRSGPTSFEKRRTATLRRAHGGHPHA